MRLLAILLPVLLGSSAFQDSGSPLQAVREVRMGSLAGTQDSYFRLDRLSSPEPQQEGPIGVVRWLHGPSSREGFHWRAECEVSFLGSGKRISLLEELGSMQRELSFRELTGSFGRRLTLRWTADGHATSVDRAGRQRRRREYQLGSTSAFPLALVEMARLGKPLPQKMSVYQPLAGEFEELDLQIIRGVESRTLRMTRKDGSTAGSYRFEGQRLISFRWQAGGMVATRLEPEAFRQLLPRSGTLEASAPKSAQSPRH